MAELGDKWKAWVERFWWLRGAAAAMSVIAIVPSFLDLSRYEFLRMFHALIVGWNRVMEVVGLWIGKIPFMPTIPGSVMNTGVFFSSLIAPLIYARFVRQRKIISLIKEYNSKHGETRNFRREARVSDVAFIFFVIAVTGFYWMLISGNYPRIESRWIQIVSALLVFNAVVFAFLFVTSAFVVAEELKGFARGIVYLISFFVVMEVMYLLNLFGGSLNSFACQILEIPESKC